MASTYSPLLRIQLITTGEQSGTWGDTTNTNLGTLIEDAIAGTATISVTSGNVTLTSINGLYDQSRCAAIRVTGTPGVSRSIIAPAASHIYVVANGSDAAVVLKTSTSTGLTIPTGQVYLAYYDSTVGVADFRMVGQAIASTNTANTLVLRDASGNFAAGTITATTFNGAHNGTVGATTPSTVAATSGTFSTTLGVTGVATFTAQPILSSLTASSAVATDASKGLVSVTNTGTGNNVLATSPTLVTPILGTPTSGTLTNCTGLPISTGVSGLGTGAATFLATPSSANLAAMLTDETGSGANVFATSPTLVTPALGTPSALVGTNITGTAAGLSIGGNLTGASPTAATQASGTNNTTVATTAFVRTALQILYPVGCIYTTTVSTNPNTLFGFGTWVAYGTGRVLIGAGTGWVAASTGGSANSVVVSHTHTLTDPGHAHNYSRSLFASAPGPIENGGEWAVTTATVATASATTGISVDTAGVSGTNANLQPYVVVYMWNRTA